MLLENYWAVGAAFGKGDNDVSEEFISNGEWYDGYAFNNGDERNKSYLEKVNVNDVLLIKSSSTKGTNHKTSFTRLKKVGIVTEKINYFHFKVKWLNVSELPKDFDNIYYGKTIEPLRNDKIYNFIKKIIEMDNLNEIINLLKYKQQIILQGPPGTGKTRMAKMIAEEMTRPKNIGSPLEKVDEFFKTFDSTKPEIKKRREELNKVYLEFLNQFPKDRLKDMTLEEYAIGTGSNDSFCWWIEIGLYELGSYSPGSARSYLIYWSKEKDDYVKTGKLIKDIDKNTEAMRKISKILTDLVENKNYEEASNYIGDSYAIKILHSYYPDEYFPINSDKCLNNSLKLLGIDPIKMNTLEKNLKLQEIYIKKKKQFKTDISSIEFMNFLFSNFDLKGKISFQSNEVVSQGEYKIIQFHPAYSYEDFVRGITAKINDEGQVEYKVENRVVIDFAEKALNNSSAKYVLVIDEINRANLPAVLGELIYALEYRYDEDNPKETTVESMYALKIKVEDLEGNKELKIPKNLYIIGTMNTADRSVGHIDYAIRRRFAFVEMPSLESVLDEVIKDDNLRNKAKKLFTEVATLFNTNHLSSDFKSNQVQLGHSYFLADTEESLKMKLEYEIKPILEEYLKDGILLDSAKEVIDNIKL